MATIIPQQLAGTVVVAAVDSKEPWRASWDDTLGGYLQCSGAADDVELNAGLVALPATGGTLILLDGTFTLTAQMARAIDNITILGQGISTILNYDGVTEVITAGTQDGWLVANLSTDAGGVDIASATNSSLHNVWQGGSMVTIANPDAGQTTFPGQEVIRLRELRHPDPAAAEPIKVFDPLEFVTDPTFALPKLISDLLNRQARTFELPLNDTWTDGSTAGTATFAPLVAILNTGGVANQDGLGHCVAAFLRNGEDVYDRVDWDNKLTIAFDVARDAGSHADLRGRVQLKEVNAEGILADLGIGIEIQNFGIHGESYGGARQTVDLGVTMTATYAYRIRIEHIPGEADYFYVNDVLMGSNTTVANIAFGDSDATCYFVLSMDNAAQAQDCNLYVSPLVIWNHL